ncbi:MAG: c-type cytochrome [Campylobacterota bacterium]|nr:c-type cytochrome [Campylobacterota bacterium]
MKKIILISLVGASMLFTACEEKSDKAVEETPSAVSEVAPEEKLSSLDAAKKAVEEAAEATKMKAVQIAEEAKVEAEKIAAAAAEKTAALKVSAEKSLAEAGSELKAQAEKVSVAASDAMASISAPSAYAKCKGCHGAEGKTVALGKSAVIAGQDKATLIASMNAYKAGTKNVSGMGGLMKGQMASVSDEDIEAIATYLSSVK